MPPRKRKAPFHGKTNSLSPTVKKTKRTEPTIALDEASSKATSVPNLIQDEKYLQGEGITSVDDVASAEDNSSVNSEKVILQISEPKDADVLPISAKVFEPKCSSLQDSTETITDILQDDENSAKSDLLYQSATSTANSEPQLEKEKDDSNRQPSVDHTNKEEDLIEPALVKSSDRTKTEVKDLDDDLKPSIEIQDAESSLCQTRTSELKSEFVKPFSEIQPFVMQLHVVEDLDNERQLTVDHSKEEDSVEPVLANSSGTTIIKAGDGPDTPIFKKTEDSGEGSKPAVDIYGRSSLCPVLLFSARGRELNITASSESQRSANQLVADPGRAVEVEENHPSTSSSIPEQTSGTTADGNGVIATNSQFQYDRLYRLLGYHDNAGEGIKAKNPFAKVSVHDHVSVGSSHNSQYISTSASWGAIERFARNKKRFPKTVATIDVRELEKTGGVRFIDLTDPSQRQEHLKDEKAKGLAAAFQEVLITGDIPAHCIKEIVNLSKGQMKKKWKSYMYYDSSDFDSYDFESYDSDSDDDYW